MNHITKKQNEFYPDLVEIIFESTPINGNKSTTKILLPKILADQIAEK
tara:strand:- start:62 stop:205 length:144 start_codon:yes stop_codon:yes gene_type:complete